MDCYNAGATLLHLHVRNPATGTEFKAVACVEILDPRLFINRWQTLLPGCQNPMNTTP